MQDIMLRLWKVEKMSNNGKWYKLVFKQKQPIHIGWSKWGVIKETAIFIPGQTMWGALVNAYILDKEVNNKTEIDNIKKHFETITNFFPTSDKKGESFLKPKYKDGEFYLENFSENKFRFYFVDTILQTAVEPILRKAKDESLHELDYILPRPKHKSVRFNSTLHWVGLIKIKEEYKDFLKESLKIYIGGDVRYGFGELELVDCSEADDNIKRKWQIENDKISIPENENTLYFIEIDLLDGKEVEGEIVPIPEFDFTKNTPEMTDCKFYLNVGSKVENNILDKSLIKGKLKNDNSG